MTWTRGRGQWGPCCSWKRFRLAELSANSCKLRGLLVLNGPNPDPAEVLGAPRVP